MKIRKVSTFVILSLLIFVLTVGTQLLRASLLSAQTNSQLIVSAAASLTDALNEIAPLYRQARPSVNIRYNFASSGALQRQIENGAPADVFISAAAKQMNELQQKNLLVAGTRRNLLSNRLVLVVPANAKSSGVSNLNSLSDVRVKRIAIGDPRSVPAGQYAQEALTKAGLWNRLKPKYVLANNVRQVLQFVEAGNADAALVYLTDARTTNRVKVVQTISTNLHSPIVYPVAVLKNSRNQTNARNFSQFLSSNTAKKVFRKYGFAVS